jgi:hypothetical protein
MKLLTISETAAMLKTTQAKIRSLVKQDPTFPVFSLGDKRHRVIAENLVVWVRTQSTAFSGKRPKMTEKEMEKAKATPETGTK